MIDFGIITTRTLLPVQSISPIREFRPPSIIVIGDRLDLTSEILFNNTPVLEFVISSPSRLIVRIPTSQIGIEFKELKVFSNVNLLQKDSIVSLNITKPIRKLQGIDRLVQSWLLVFLTSPGSDVFSPRNGGGAFNIIGRTTNRAGKGVLADLALAVDRTKSEILKLQAANQRIPLEERLLSSNLEEAQFDSNTGAILARVSLRNALGNAAEVSIG